MTYRFIEEHQEQWPVRWLCQTLEVSPAGYYAWRQAPRRPPQQRRDTLVVEIRAVHAEFKARYGSPRIHAEWDNAPMESFFASLKKELVHNADFATRAEARAAILEYIEVFYNTKRRHSSLGYVSPAEYEQSE